MKNGFINNPSVFVRRTSVHAATIVALVASVLAHPGITMADNSASASAKARWEKIDESDGIVVEKREMPDSSLIAFRGTGTIDAPLLRVASVIVDSSRSTEWIENLKDTRFLRKISDTEYVQYNHISTPFIMTDRDFVILTKLEIDKPKKQFILRIKSTEDPAAPKTDFVRGVVMNSSFILTSINDGKRTKLETEIHCDPKGNVANWMVNMVQKDWPHNTIVRLRKQVAKRDIKLHAELAAVFKAQGFLQED